MAGPQCRVVIISVSSILFFQLTLLAALRATDLGHLLVPLLTKHNAADVSSSSSKRVSSAGNISGRNSSTEGSHIILFAEDVVGGEEVGGNNGDDDDDSWRAAEEDESESERQEGVRSARQRGSSGTKDGRGGGSLGGELGRDLREERRRRQLTEPITATSFHRMRTRPKDTCWSQSEQKYFYHTEVASTTSFVEKLRNYEEMHKKCTAVDDWNAFFDDQSRGRKDGADISGCKYLFWEPPKWHGLGNRLMSLVSSFTFALLTDRTFLIPRGTFVSQFLCNPFQVSSWEIDEGQFFSTLNAINSQAKKNGEFQNSDWNGKAAKVTISWNTDDYMWNFPCAEEQAAMDRGTFMTLDSDEYFIPLLYLVPKFEAQLNNFFPDRKVFTHVGRFLLHPINYLWDRIVRIFRAHMEHHNVRIGIQIRSFEDDDGKADNRDRVLECAVHEAQVLPQCIPNNMWKDMANHADNPALRNPNGETIVVFVTSLDQKHYEYFKDVYTNNKPEDGSIVSVHCESYEGKEKSEKLEQYEKALVEMWLLSFCDRLLVSDYSTFGYVASGLNGLRPHTLNVAIRAQPKTDWRTNGRPSCQISTSEPCLLKVPDNNKIVCNGEEKDITRTVPYVKACPGIGFGLGVETSDFGEEG